MSAVLTAGALQFRAVVPSAGELDGANLIVPDLQFGDNAGHSSFEDTCKNLEEIFTRPCYGIVCTCCASSAPCETCCHAVGFHVCSALKKTRYRKGSLYDRALDGQRVLFNMHRKGLPTEVIEEKKRAYVENAILTDKEAQAIMNAIHEHRSEEKHPREPDLAGTVDEDSGDTSVTRSILSWSTAETELGSIAASRASE